MIGADRVAALGAEFVARTPAYPVELLLGPGSKESAIRVMYLNAKGNFEFAKGG